MSRASPALLLPRTAAPNAEDTLSFTMVMEMPQSLRDSSSPVWGMCWQGGGGRNTSILIWNVQNAVSVKPQGMDVACHMESWAGCSNWSWTNNQDHNRRTVVKTAHWSVMSWLPRLCLVTPIGAQVMSGYPNWSTGYVWLSQLEHRLFWLSQLEHKLCLVIPIGAHGHAHNMVN